MVTICALCFTKHDTSEEIALCDVIMAELTLKTEGLKYDKEKPRTDLLPSKALVAVAEVLAKGAVKYDTHNWRKGIAWSRVYAATQRHLFAWNDGQTIDKESGFNHLAHACCNLMFLLEYAETHRDLDDRFGATKRSDDG